MTTANVAPDGVRSEAVAVPRTIAPLRIVHVLNELTQVGNGIVNVAMDLAIDQAREGHDVTVAAPSGAYLELLRANGVKHFSVKPQSALRLRSLVRRTRPHILHAHMMSGAVSGRIACAGTNTALVTTVHNSWSRHAVLMRFGHRVIAVSDAVRDDMILRGVPAERIETVLNGTVGSFRKPAGVPPAPVTLNHPNVITVAGMFERKGIADLIEATVLVRERVPTITTYLLGDGADRAAFEKLAHERGVGGSVVFLGFRSDAEAVMRQADVFVLASHADSNPLVIPEARAAGLPIVATRVDGIPESLDGGDAGLLVPPRSPDAIANAIVGLLLDSAHQDRMRAASLRNLERLSVRRMATETMAVYGRAMATRTKDAPRRATVGVREDVRAPLPGVDARKKRGMKLLVIANRVYRHGGMERASAEVFSRIAHTDDLTIIAAECEIANGDLTWLPVRAFRRPAMLGQALFARAAKKLERAGSYELTVSVDSAARDADVVIAHFCLGMFSRRFAGLRGGRSRIRRVYQRIAERSLAARERGLYRSKRLRGVIAVSSGLKRELIEQYGIDESLDPRDSERRRSHDVSSGAEH